MTHKTVFDNNFQIIDSDKEYDYQKALTRKLDNLDYDLDQNLINEIVLWKISRYAEIDEATLKLINSLDRHSEEIDEKKTKEVLKSMLSVKGIQLPMASTILRFRNKKVYQIIDQRVFRIIYPNQKLKLNTYRSEKNSEAQIHRYFQFLKKLKKFCIEHKMPFENSDRILYMADKRINKDIPLDNYSKKGKDIE